MSFRKRNVAVSSPGKKPSITNSTEPVTCPGVRPSPLDGRLTTSSGTRSLDALLAGHAGLPLGTSILIEESGTTDFAGILLRYFAAEGVVQSQVVHVLGAHEGWERELPGATDVVAGLTNGTNESKISNDRMKIAWRYERLGDFGRGKRPARHAWGSVNFTCSTKALRWLTRGGGLDRNTASTVTIGPENSTKPPVFCHEFDLSKRLHIPSPTLLKLIPIIPQKQPGQTETTRAIFTGFLQHLVSQLAAAGPTVVHRVIIPNLISPAAYPDSASNPEEVLQFLHALRALLRRHSSQLVVFITIPLSLYPRTTGLTRWIELLSDGVLELAPFLVHADSAVAAITSGPATSLEDLPQGLLKVHRIPVFHEKGGGVGESIGQEDDLAFTLSRRKGLVIKPFSLPPIDGESKAQGAILEGKAAKVDMEF